MPTKQIMVDVAKTERDKGSATNGVSKSDYRTLSSCYPGSPILAESVTDVTQKQKFYAVLRSNAIVTPDGTFNLMFGESLMVLYVSGFFFLLLQICQLLPQLSVLRLQVRQGLTVGVGLLCLLSLPVLLLVLVSP